MVSDSDDNSTSMGPRMAGELFERFRQQAMRRPNALAVVHGTATATYGELLAAGLRLARQLREQGVERGEVIALCLDRSIGFIVAQLGVFGVGGICLPLDPASPLPRRQQLISATGARIVIEPGTSPGSGSGQVSLKVLDRSSGRLRAGLEKAEPRLGVGFLLFTSGSTGEPKGVCIRHASVVHLVCDTDYVRFDADDVVLHGAHVSFDAMLFEVWGPLLHGARIEVVDKRVMLDPHLLEAVLRERKMTIGFLTTSLFNLVAMAQPQALGGFRYVLVGGEMADAGCLRRVLESGRPPANLLNAYGPTEATTFTTTHRVEALSASTRTVPIGRAIRRARVHLLDENLQPVPAGEIGEIFIGGDGVAAGYWGRPDLTSQRFLPDPQGADPNARMYASGDLARVLPDGTLDFLGRRDGQIKLRGNRIEPGEVESILRGHPDLLDGAVVADLVDGVARRLVAFVVWRPGSNAVNDAEAERAVIAWMRERCPGYLVPARIVTVPELPRTASGKADRQALVARVNHDRTSTAVSAGQDAESPETLILAIWRRLLGRGDITLDDSFFELGGDSLLAVRMFLEVQQCTGASPSLPNWLKTPSVRTLIESIGSLPSSSPEAPAHPQIFLIGWLFHVEAADLGGVPFHVLPFPEGGETDATCSVRHLAEGCAGQLKALRTRSPWFVVGYSLAGLVALEVARLMTAVGDAPTEVWMIDSVPPGILQSLGVTLARRVGVTLRWPFRRQLLLARGLHSVAELALPTLQFRFAEAWRRLRIELRRFTRFARRGRASNVGGSGVRVSDRPNLTHPANHHPHIWANHGYRREAYPGPVISFVTQETQNDHPEPGNGWSPVLSGLKVIPIPGDHATCVREQRGALIAGFRERLDHWRGESVPQRSNPPPDARETGNVAPPTKIVARPVSGAGNRG